MNKTNKLSLSFKNKYFMKKWRTEKNKMKVTRGSNRSIKYLNLSLFCASKNVCFCYFDMKWIKLVEKYPKNIYIFSNNISIILIKSSDCYLYLIHFLSMLKLNKELFLEVNIFTVTFLKQLIQDDSHNWHVCVEIENEIA